MANKACRVCKHITSKEQCPVCGSKELSSDWKGKIVISDFERSKLSERLKIKANGQYAIRA